MEKEYKVLDKNGWEMPYYRDRRRTYDEAKTMVDRLNRGGEFRPYTMEPVVENELKEIGTALIPSHGMKTISKVEKPFPRAPFCDVTDMEGVKYRNINVKSVYINPTPHENQDPAV